MEKSKKKYLGDVIQTYRKLKGLTQEQLAERVNVSYQQIQQYEYKKSNPPLEILEKIIVALEIPLSKIFNISEKPDPLKEINEELLKNSEAINLVKEYPESVALAKILKKNKSKIDLPELKKLFETISQLNKHSREHLLKFVVSVTSSK